MTAPRIACHRYCPSCGYDQRGAPDTGVRCCPECGTETAVDDLLLDPPRSPASLLFDSAARLVVFGLGTGIIIALILPGLACTRCPGRQKPSLYLGFYASTHQRFVQDFGREPVHPIEMAIDGFATPSVFDGGPRCKPLNAPRLGDDLAAFRLGNGAIDLWSEESAACIELLLDETETEEPPVVRCGSTVHVRLAQSSTDARLILAWSTCEQDDARPTAFRNGRVALLDRDGWYDAWQADARARAELGIGQIGLVPPW